MQKMLRLLIVGYSAAFLIGCASGPKYSTVKSSLPSLAPENGRVFFYRTAILGAAVQPAVKLNGEKVGTAKPGGFFFVDRPPGSCEVETTTEVKRRLTFTLDKGQTRFVRLNISIGFMVGHVYPELIQNQVAEGEIINCSQVTPK